MSASSATMSAAGSLIEAPAQAPAKSSKGKSGKGKLALVAIVVVVAALAFTFLKPSGGEAGALTPAEPVAGEVVDVGRMNVNLADGGRYARVSFSLVLAQGATLEQVSPKFPLVKEGVLFELSNVAATDLRAEGGLDAIAERLSERTRQVYPDGEVLRVVLTELLVQ